MAYHPPTKNPSGRGRQVAAAAVVIFLLALAAAAYFVLRGPNHSRTQVEPGVVASETPSISAPSTEQASSKDQPQAKDDQQSNQASEDKKRVAEESRRAAQDAAAIEAEKKAEAKAQSKAENKNASQAPHGPNTPTVVPAPADALPEPEHRSSTPGQNGCVVVTVKDPDGMPAQGMRVAATEPDNGSAHSGRTGPKGRWHDCGFTPGHRILVTVFGPRGAVLASQQSVIAAGTNFIEIRGERNLDESRPLGPRRRPLFKRP